MWCKVGTNQPFQSSFNADPSTMRWKKSLGTADDKTRELLNMQLATTSYRSTTCVLDCRAKKTKLAIRFCACRAVRVREGGSNFCAKLYHKRNGTCFAARYSMDCVNAGGREKATKKLESGTMRLISKSSWGWRRCDKSYNFVEAATAASVQCFWVVQNKTKTAGNILIPIVAAFECNQKPQPGC